MIEAPRRIGHRRADIIAFQVWKLLHYLIEGKTRLEQVEHILHPHAHAANAGATAALGGIGGDAGKKLAHVPIAV